VRDNLERLDIDIVLKRRRMVRAFKPRPVEGEKLWSILRNAHRSPSAGHLEPQEFIVVKDLDVKRRLAHAALDQTFIAEAPVVIVVCADTRRNVWRYGERGRRFYCIIDGAFASMLILLTAVNEGLGACFVGAFHDEEVAKILSLPREVRPIDIIPIGYPDEEPERVARRPIEGRIHFDLWGNHTQTEAELKEVLKNYKV